MAETWETLGKLQELRRGLKSAGILKTKIPASVVRPEKAPDGSLQTARINVGIGNMVP